MGDAKSVANFKKRDSPEVELGDMAEGEPTKEAVKRESLYEITANWVEAGNVTSHGCPKFFIDKYGWAPRIIWMAIFLGAFAVFIWYLVVQIQLFYQYQYNTTVDIKFEPQQNFPSVTFCNINRMRYSKLVELVQSTPAFAALLANQTVDIDSLADAQRPSVKTMKALGHQLNETVLSCKFKGTKCADNDTTLWNTFTTLGQGNCFTFNTKANLVVSKPGRAAGLSLQLAVQQDEYMFSTQSVGFLVVVHTPGEIPDFENSFTVDPGSETNVKISVRKIQNMGPPYTTCNPDKTLSQCSRDCLAREYVARCGCNPDDESANCYDTTTKATCMDNVEGLYNSDSLGCACTNGCQATDYNLEISRAAWPSRNYENVLVNYYSYLDPGVLREEYLQMNVYYGTLNSESVTQSEAMTAQTLASNLGGMLGLCIGSSAISFFEAFEWIYVVVRARLQQRRRVGAV